MEDAESIKSSMSWESIATEHCYPKVMAQWTSTTESLPTYHLFKPVKCESVSNSTESLVDDDIDIDVESVPSSLYLPYNERKVVTIMSECSQHLNLVQVPTESPSVELEKVFKECGYQKQILLTKLLQILKEELLARLTFAGAEQEPIKRRLHCDKATRQFRKVLTDIKWDSNLTQWVHRTLMKTQDADMLPVYLDILQGLKSKCPALIEHMIHGGPPGDGNNEVLDLLLKRPWNPLAGMTPMDKQVRFDPSPIFISVPHSNSVLGSKRWRLWQSQLSSIGKVYPVVVPDYVHSEGISLQDAVGTLIHYTVARIQELKEQNPTRPVVLISWSTGCRIACKAAEVEKVSCLVNLGLPVRGWDHTWTVASDPFINSTTASIFIVGDNNELKSSSYIEEIRAQMKCITSLVTVHGADDLLRLSCYQKCDALLNQSMVDRILQDKIYEFLVYILPCSFPVDIRHAKKRKTSAQEEQSSSYLSNVTPNSPIVLTHSSEDKNGSLANNSSAMLKTIFGKQLSSTASANKQSQSLAIFPHIGVPNTKAPRVGRPPKLGRPRSKSATVTSDSKTRIIISPSQPSTPTANTNNNNNSTEVSPNALLSLTHAQVCPLLPITPPKNPFENPNSISDPKTLKQLNLQ